MKQVILKIRSVSCPLSLKSALTGLNISNPITQLVAKMRAGWKAQAAAAAALLVALLVTQSGACPNDRPDIRCFRGGGIDGAPLPAPTVNCKWISLSLNVTYDVRIRDLDLLLSIDHAGNSQLIIKLEGPSGTQQTIADLNLKGSDVVQAIISDEAAKAWTDASAVAPYTGTWKTTDGSLTAWDGINARGEWKLWVYDYWSGRSYESNRQTGVVEQWQLHITPAAFCSPPRFQNSVADGNGGQTSTCVSACPGPLMCQSVIAFDALSVYSCASCSTFATLRDISTSSVV